VKTPCILREQELLAGIVDADGRTEEDRVANEDLGAALTELVE
jgi:hypothetical protein